MGKVGIAGLICCGVSLTLIVVSTALPYWCQYKYEFGHGVISQGLWMFCSKHDGEEEADCQEMMPPVYEYVLAVRALVLMGLIMVASANVLGLVGFFVIRQKRNISLIAGVISISAGICMLTGAIVFAGRTSYLVKRDVFVQYHAGFALAIGAGVIGIVAGILFIRGRPSEENQSSSPLLN